MRYETVDAIWDYYDGPRTGIAKLNGSPHYFDSIFDRIADEYSNKFRLYPVTPEFMRHAMQKSAIYNEWETKYRSGTQEFEAHPRNGGINTEYGRLQKWIDDAVPGLTALPTLYMAKFRPRENQNHLPFGMMRELEVAWTPISA